MELPLPCKGFIFPGFLGFSVGNFILIRLEHQGEILKKYLRCVCPSIQSTLTEWEWSTTASERIICCVLFCCSASAQLLSSLHPRQSSGTHPQLTASFAKSSIWGLWTTWEARGRNVKAALCSVSVRRCCLGFVPSVSTSYMQIASGALCVVLHAPVHGGCFSVSDFKKTVSCSYRS